MANEQNIKPHRKTSNQSREEAAKNGHKGGVASGKARREKKALREIVIDILSRPAVVGGKKLTTPDGAPIENYQAALVASMLNQALKGNVKAAQQILEWSGETNSQSGLTINVSLGK